MVPRVILLFCCTAVACSSRVEVNFLLDEPSRQVEVGHTVHLKCHYNITGGAVDLHWVIFFNTSMPFIVPLDTRVTLENKTNSSLTLIVRQVTQNDTGLYCCYVNDTKVMNPFSSGTYLQVYEPLKKTINISESAKNRILVAEGILLLLCLMVPGTILISKTKKDSELEKKKSKIEEENIYEGLNLDDCNSAYHQIQRSQVQCPYQDVDNIRDDDIQLEKP